MKNIAFIFALTLILLIFSAMVVFAQKSSKTPYAGPVTIQLNKNGEAKIQVQVPAKGTATYAISGKGFKKLGIKALKAAKFKYEIHQGKEFLSSGHTTGSNIFIESDGKSTYYFSVISDDVILFVTLFYRDYEDVAVH